MIQTFPSDRHVPANAGDTKDSGLIPGSGRCPGGGNGNPFQYPCLENPMDRAACRVIAHGVAKSRTQLSTQTHYTHTTFSSRTTLEENGGNSK